MLKWVEVLRWPLCVVLCAMFASMATCNESCSRVSREEITSFNERTKICNDKYSDPLDVAVCTGNTSQIFMNSYNTNKLNRTKE